MSEPNPDHDSHAAFEPDADRAFKIALDTLVSIYLDKSADSEYTLRRASVAQAFATASIAKSLERIAVALERGAS
jgi:DTW domain-containing protein YfiP